MVGVLLKLNTGSQLENRVRFRASLHFFRWGIHWKLRLPTGTWRHFVIKFARGSALGQRKARTQLWIGWWQSRRGVRRDLNGFRCGFYFDRLPPRPAKTIAVPFFPQEPREKERAT